MKRFRRQGDWFTVAKKLVCVWNQKKGPEQISTTFAHGWPPARATVFLASLLSNRFLGWRRVLDQGSGDTRVSTAYGHRKSPRLDATEGFLEQRGSPDDGEARSKSFPSGNAVWDESAQ